MEKSKIWAFDPVIYPFEILMTKDFDVDEIKETFNVVCVDDVVMDISDEFFCDDYTTARIVNVARKNTNKRYIMIIMFKPKDIGVGICAHEALHLTNAYLQYLGLSSPLAYNDEAYAYFIQWVTNCMWSVLLDETITMNGTLLK